MAPTLMRRSCRPPFALLLAGLLSACGTSSDPGDGAVSSLAGLALVTGTWRAWLDVPEGGPLPFELHIADDGERATAQIRNGLGNLDVESVRSEDGALVLDMTAFDSRIIATPSADGRRLDGTWSMMRTKNRVFTLDFHATAGEQPRFEAFGDPGADAPSLEGRWRVQFSSDEHHAVGEFAVDDDGQATGTFITAMGDYRYLAGAQVGRSLRLSCFDGGHAFLFHAELGTDGSLTGDFWSGNWWHETWTATRDADVVLPDAFGLVSWKEDVDVGDLAFPDLDGTSRRLDDPAFEGKARIVQVFGSWCPNCHDATDEIARLSEKYGERGLSIVGLAFEHNDDFRRNVEQVRAYASKVDVDWPLLIAGRSVKDEATASLGILDKVAAFPTTIFLHGDGRVRAVYSGFSGPATGDAFTKQRQQFETIVEELLAEGG